MNPTPETSAEAPTISQGVDTMLHDVQSKAAGKLESYEEMVRLSPEKAVLIAAAAGYCLHVLPTRALLAAPIRLVAFLAKPALLALGAVKVCEIVQNQVRKEG